MNTILNDQITAEETDLIDTRNSIITISIFSIHVYPIFFLSYFDFFMNGIMIFDIQSYISLYKEAGFFGLIVSFMFIGFFLMILVVPLIIFFRSWIYYILGRQYMALLRDFIDRTADITTSVEHIDEILNISQTIHTLISKKHRFFYIFSHAGDKIKRWNSYLSYVITILTDLRSDLIYRLKEQQQILTSAQSELDHHVTGTTELDQVATLQRQRLDEQIRQFEEIQRVLV